MYIPKKQVGLIGEYNEGIIIPGYFSIPDLTDIHKEKTPGTTGDAGDELLKKLGITIGSKPKYKYETSILHRPNF